MAGGPQRVAAAMGRGGGGAGQRQVLPDAEVKLRGGGKPSAVRGENKAERTALVGELLEHRGAVCCGEGGCR